MAARMPIEASPVPLDPMSPGGSSASTRSPGPPGRWARLGASLRAWLDRSRRRLERWRPGNLVPLLIPGGDLRPGDGTFELTLPKQQFFLPSRRYRAGFYVLVLHVRGSERRGYAELFVDEGSGFLEDSAYGLVTKQEKSVFRIVYLRRGAVGLRLDASEQAGPVDIPICRFHRVPRFFAWRRMLRRIGLEHTRLATQKSIQLRKAIDSYAREHALTRDQAVFRLYSDTFGLRRTPGNYDAWMRLVEEPANAVLDVWPVERPGPTISVLIPTYDTRPEHLRACLDSVLEQSYPHFELCVVDDASPNPRVRALLARYAADPRVRVLYRERNGHICQATNDALALATGEYVALLDHDDLLARHALLRMVLAIFEQPAAKMLYGDEDKLSEDGRRKDPHFKCQFNPDLLLSQAYIGHLVVARTSEVRAIGGFRLGYEGSQDHDLVLRLSERCGAGEIVHVPFVLYHWRESAGSTALHPNAKGYAAEAGRRAVQDALVRHGRVASVEQDPFTAHGYRVRFALPDPLPLVSVLVPTRDAVALLRLCVGSLLEKTSYPRVELLIIDNGSVEAETFAYFDEVTQDSRVRVVRHAGVFNFSALNNRGARVARGEILALVNNDIEPIDGDWLGEMVSHAVRPEIGCVGAKLLYPDDRIQHAGVITGIGGVAGHAHKYLHRDEAGYHGRLRLTHNLSAVTAACLLVRRSTFERVGGFDEQLAIAFNDVDFCLRVRSAGYRNLFTPYAVLYHHESATRGSEVTDAQIERFAAEVRLMKERWGYTLRADPFYSPHLSLEREDFSIGLHARELRVPEYQS